MNLICKILFILIILIKSVNADNLVNDSEVAENHLNCDSEKINTDTLQFSEAFKYYRNCNHDTFTWNGVEYTTILKSEINDKLEENPESLTNKLDLVSK